jgi:uncharacterized protein YndB with AHSA1/START domain
MRVWLMWSVGGLVVLVVGGVGLGLLLPVAHHVVVSRVVPAVPEAVWTALTDVDAFPAWRPGVQAVRRLEDDEGLPGWVETAHGRSMTLRVDALDPPRRMVTRIADREAPFGGTWTYELEPHADGTLVRITEDGEIHNPIFRLVARYVLGYETTISGYLDALDGHMASRP